MKAKLFIGALTLLGTLLLVSQFLADPEEFDFEVDPEDYEHFSKISTNRTSFESYDSKAILYLEMVCTDDDYDQDGNSTINNCIAYLQKISGHTEVTVPEILAYIRSFEYISDQDQYFRFDWATYPIETLQHKKGDCEDLTILFLALAHRFGYDCGIAIFEDHVLPMVYFENVDIGSSNTELSTLSITLDEKTYWACETTGHYPIGQTYNRYHSAPILSYRLME